MGLLDDAIREHLDLKRRRGADPTEIERAEQEALGPVRRGPEAPEPAGAEDDASPAYDHEDEEEWEEEEVDERPPAPSAPSEEEYDRFGDEEDEARPRHVADDATAGEDEPEPSTRGRARFRDEEPFADDEPFADAPPAQPSTGRSGSEPDAPTSPPPHPAAGSPPASAGGETVEYDALAPEVDEDVLEETPEFLQDTPDHDRLWFEQKPPRDFDFNE